MPGDTSRTAGCRLDKDGNERARSCRLSPWPALRRGQRRAGQDMNPLPWAGASTRTATSGPCAADAFNIRGARPACRCPCRSAGPGERIHVLARSSLSSSKRRPMREGTRPGLLVAVLVEATAAGGGEPSLSQSVSFSLSHSSKVLSMTFLIKEPDLCCPLNDVTQ